MTRTPAFTDTPAPAAATVRESASRPTLPAPPAVPAAEPGAWEGLVTSALLGTDRRTPPGGERGPGAAAALLDAAAAETVRR
ncbi:hypothetical protein G3I61_05635, partial [Streptomyces diastaticus]|nr:hypothetical protein [Streptomyces diastaticus]